MPGMQQAQVKKTAIDVNDREDTDQYRFTINVDQSLPAALADFQAQSNDKGQIDLSWRTLNETNHDRFFVERSRDGVSFEEVGAVAGAGESREEQAYTFLDHFPLPGQSFYRLRQVDQDGTTTYSQVIPVEVSTEITLYPNPVVAQLSLAGFAGGRVEVYDGLGRQVIRTTITANGSLTVEELPPGRYLLRAGGKQLWWIK